MTIDELSVKISVAAEEAAATLDGLTERVEKLARALETRYQLKVDAGGATAALGWAEQAGDSVDAVKARLAQEEGLFADWLRAAAAQGKTVVETEGREWSGALGQQLMELLQNGLDVQEGEASARAFVEQAVGAVSAACASPEAAAALETLNGLKEQMMEGCMPTAEQADVAMAAWNGLIGEDSPLNAAAQLLAQSTGEAMESMKEKLLYVLTDLGGLDGLLADTSIGAEEAGRALNAMAETGQGLRELGDNAAEAEKQTRGLVDSAKRLGEQKTAVAQAKQLSAQYQRLSSEGKDTAGVARAMNSEIKKAGSSFQMTNGNVAEFDKALGKAEQSIGRAAATMAGELSDTIAWAGRTRDSLYIDGVITANEAPVLDSLNAIIALANVALQVLQAVGLVQSGGTAASTKRGGGGGGGKKKDTSAEDAQRAAEEAARAAEEARKEAIQRDYDYIDHKRHLNQITLEEELALLERIRTAHQLNAEEIMEWEEKIYDLKKELRERDAGSIDTLAEGVVSALEGRYEAMRAAELERLDQSRKAWEQWRDDSVQAINDQISALDKLSDTEDREKRDAEELRKIEKLRREIQYEQDDYNRAKLEQQLSAALDSREDRLRKLALQDQKDALREEIDRINEKADEQLSALDKEQDSIEAAYEERLKTAALNAEAEKLLLTQGQEEIMDLLGQYVPEYNALGQSMGEKLLDGFKSKVGDVVSWFKDFNEGIVAMQAQFAAASNTAADSLYQSYAGRQSGSGEAGAASGVTVNQNVIFNEAVESPSQVARRMEDVNDALGELLG